MVSKGIKYPFPVQMVIADLDWVVLLMSAL